MKSVSDRVRTSVTAILSDYKKPSMPTYTNAREAEAVRRARMELQSLQTQASMRRHKTSETIGDLIVYVNGHLSRDLLIYPDKVNPFKPKKMCNIM